MADTWKREELYRDVWQEPMLKLAKKYGVSDVMLAKACRKLNIPVPGRGYWARKASGQRLRIEPLPELKDVPVIQRFKLPEPESKEPKMPEPEPTDSEYLRIRGQLSVLLDQPRLQERPSEMSDRERRHLFMKYSNVRRY